MLRSDFFAIAKIPLWENNANSSFVVGDLDAYINLHQKEWFQFVEKESLFLPFFKNTPTLDITTVTNTNHYQYRDVGKFASTTGSMTGSGGITAVTDTEHTQYITTDKVVQGDRLLHSGVYHDIVEVAEDTLSVLDPNDDLSEATEYSVCTRPLFIIQAQFTSDLSNQNWIPMNRRSEIMGKNYTTETRFCYVTNGDYIETFPNIHDGTIRLYYAPYPLTFSSSLLTITNPFGFDDEITEAFAYFLASRHFEDRPNTDMNQVKKLMNQCLQKLSMSRDAGQVAWGNK